MHGAVFIEGRLLDPREARVSLLDRGYLLGDGGFETVRVYARRPFDLAAHLDRLEHTARVLGIALPVERAPLIEQVHRTIAHSGLEDAYLRITLTRGPGAGGLATRGAGPATLSVLVLPPRLPAADSYAQGIPSTVVRTRRVPAACLDPTIKSCAYLPQIQAKRELEAQGLLEGVQLSIDGAVVSGTASNVFAVRAGELRTPHLASGCLPGVTRAHILRLADAVGLRPRECHLEVRDLLESDEVFFTSTLLECLPVQSLVTVQLGVAPGRYTRALTDAYRELCRGDV